MRHLLAIAITLSIGCAHKAAPQVEPPKPVIAVPLPAPAPVAVPMVIPEPTAPPVAGPSLAPACELPSVHFAYDSSLVTKAERVYIERSAACLKNTEGKVVISGHADERGTDEYNMALGGQRAVAVAKALALFGVSKKRLHTISYGENRPLCNDKNDACWQQNRRADLTH